MKKLFFLLLIIVIIIGIIFGIKKENYENVKETNNIEETNIENQETIESNKNLIEEETDTTINNVVNVSIEELQDMKKEIFLLKLLNGKVKTVFNVVNVH